MSEIYSPTFGLKFRSFKPAGEGPFPLVVVVPGGGFISLNRSAAFTVARKFQQQGFHAVVPDYRVTTFLQVELDPDAAIGAAVQDVKACVRYCNAHRSVMHIDPARMYVCGLSAGGFAALGAAYNNEFDYVKVANLDWVHQKCNIKRVCNMWGGIRKLEYINEQIPNLLIHGSADKKVPYTHGAAFGIQVFGSSDIHDYCLKNRIHSELQTWAGFSHGLTNPGIQNENLEAASMQAVEFFNETI